MCRRYKSYKDAKNLASKGNSLAGATAHQIATNATSLLVMQHKKCACFEIFDAVFGSSPNVKPVCPLEVGGDPCPDSQEDPDEDSDLPAPARVRTGGGAVKADPDEASDLPAPARVRTGGGAVKALFPTAPVTLAPGKVAAAFHLAPSKKEKKMDLGEAYLKAQQTRTDTQAVTAQTKTRCDLIIALTLQGKDAVEIAKFLQVCFA
jgi:hypothetical protein